MVPMLAAWMSERGPDLAREGGDRGFAAGAGDGGDRCRLAREECRRGQRERAPRIGDRHEGDVVRQPVRPLLGGDRHRAGRDRLLAKCAPSALAPAMATNRKPGLTLRLSAAMPRDLERAAHSAARSSASGDQPSLRASIMQHRADAFSRAFRCFALPRPGSAGRPWAGRSAARGRAAARCASITLARGRRGVPAGGGEAMGLRRSPAVRRA